MRRTRPGRTYATLIALCALSLPVVAQTASLEVATTSDDSPPILAALDLPGSATALAIQPDGQRASYAAPSRKKGQVDIVEVGLDGSRRVATLEGSITDLLYLPDNETLIGAHQRTLKRRLGESYLISWPRNEAKPNRILRLPPTTRDLDLWPAEQAILIACANEIRTILLPDFRSGKLFTIPGENLSVSAMGRGQHILVGNESGLSLYDMSLPSGRDSMPSVARQATDSPVVTVADLADGRRALILMADGTLARASFDPPTIQAMKQADWLVRTTPRELTAALPKPVARQSEPIEERVASEPVQPSEEPPPPTPPSPPATRPKVNTEPTPTLTKVEETESAVVDSPEPPPPAIMPKKERPRAELQRDAQLFGRLTGGHTLAREVVLWGPNNIMREAARVPVRDGVWSVTGLDPGRYRVQVHSGGSSILVTEPRFLMVDVHEEPQQTADIDVKQSF